MNTEQIINKLCQAQAGVFPKDALRAAMANKNAITPLLTNLLDQAAADINGLAKRKNDYGFLYAMFLLAQFREKEALAPLVAFFRHGEPAIALTGDVVTESLGQLLAAVCGGDTGAIQDLIEDPSVDAFVRAAGLEALLCLVAWREADAATVTAYFSGLITSRLERQASHVWNYLAEAASRLGGPDLAAPLKKAYDEGLISPLYIKMEEMNRQLERSEQDKQADLEQDGGLAAITNVVAEMESWACFRPQDQRLHPQPSSQPVVRAAKVGRNEPCPCGSGKKYKKCCLRS